MGEPGSGGSLPPAPPRPPVPLGGGRVAGAGAAVPGAVGVAGQAAVGTGFPIHVAAVQGQVGHPYGRGHVQLLLLGGTKRTGEMLSRPHPARSPPE